MSGLKYVSALAILLIAGAGASACNNEAYCFSCEAGGNGGEGGNGNGGNEGGGAPCETPCSDEETCCDGTCANLQVNAENCGECGNACPSGANGAAVCTAGDCSFECASGYSDCNLLFEDGCEIDIVTDTAHCGDCETICLFANATPKCEGGTCGILACNAGYDDCNGMLADGCEVNLGTDPLHCTTCNNACPAPPNAEADCLAGQCAFGGCVLGYGDCDDDTGNGCEIDLKTDDQNCGVCGYICPPLPNATPTCSNAACIIGGCDAGFADCDASTFDGCETILATDENHCGACNQPCPDLPHAYPECESAQCKIGGCEAGYADCNGMVADGCEVDLSSDEANCGACDNVCPQIANGTPACSGFACGIGACDAGFDDCFGGATDGCETNLTTDVAHCGTCGNVCPPVAFGQKACANSMCGIGMCSPDYKDCNNDAMDGCETNVTSDVMNCGMCNNACPDPDNGSAACEDSACTLGACDAGFSDCNGNPDDGCEFDTTSDPNNCGGCGIKCHSGTCNAGACQCEMTVLLIKDDSDTGTAVLATALTNAGYTVTTSPVPVYQYNGTNPSLAGFGTVVVLSGGPGNSFTTDMPAAGQAALVSHVNTAGGGLVLTEWAAYHVASGRWQTLAPLVLLQRTVAYSGQVVYQVDAPFTAHPIWAGLPAQFTIASTSNVGTTKAGTGIARIAGSPQAIDAVAIRNTPVGRIAEVAHAGNYAPNGWTNVNMQKLITNAVGWTARCTN
jgi:hypothetical protein